MTPHSNSTTGRPPSIDLDGWERGLPDYRSTDQFAAVDAEVAGVAACQFCLHLGLTYHPYRRTDGTRGYRALTACPQCGAWEEF